MRRAPTDLVQGGESVHIGVIDVGASVQQLEDLVRVAAGAGGQEDGAIVELHLGLLALHHRRLEVRLRADPALQLLVPLLLRVRHLHPPLLPPALLIASGGEGGGGEGEARGRGGCATVAATEPPGAELRAGEETLETSSIPQSTGASPAELDLSSSHRRPPAPRHGPPARLSARPSAAARLSVTSRDRGRGGALRPVRMRAPPPSSFSSSPTPLPPGPRKSAAAERGGGATGGKRVWLGLPGAGTILEREGGGREGKVVLRDPGLRRPAGRPGEAVPGF